MAIQMKKRTIGNATLYCGDSREVLAELHSELAVDAVVTDPPYGLSKEPDMADVIQAWMTGEDYVHGAKGFMGKEWDAFVPGPATWHAISDCMKPGAHLLAFAGTRTYDLMSVSIRFADYEIRDMISWVYGSGFPKSHNVSKAIDKAAGAEREKIRTPMGKTGNKYAKGLGDDRPWMQKAAAAGYHEHDSSQPATDAARQWEGWGTALKPAVEPCVLARKPFKGTVAANVLAHGTGAINIDGCRVGTADDLNPNDYNDTRRTAPKFSGILNGGRNGQYREQVGQVPDGRWPANLIHDGSDEVTALFPETGKAQKRTGKRTGVLGEFAGQDQVEKGQDDDGGSAARFFYTAKAAKGEREFGLAGVMAGVGALRDGGRESQPRANVHPTVKPISLMQYLCRLVTRPGGLILDPFMGSGTTGMAAHLGGFHFVGIERDPEYFEIACARIAAAQENSAKLAKMIERRAKAKTAAPAKQPKNTTQPRKRMSNPQLDLVFDALRHAAA